MLRIVDTGVCNHDDVRCDDVETRVDDEVVFGVSDVVIQVLSPSDDNRCASNRHVRQNSVIAHGSSTRSVGVVCTSLTKIRRDVVSSGFLVHGMNGDTVTTAVHDERDRPTLSGWSRRPGTGNE